MKAVERAFLARARTATLATIRPDGRPRLVPVCFVLLDAGRTLWSPLDAKPKQSDDPRTLARVGDISVRAAVAILVDRWDEDWTRLAWLRADGRAALVEPGQPGHDRAVEALRAKYPQYAAHDLERRPAIRIDLVEVRSWGDLSDPEDLSGRGTTLPPPAGGSGSSPSPGGSPRR